jgi:hypothetical protein
VAENDRKFHCVLHLDDEGEVVCFCPYEEAVQGRCVCRDAYNCSEAMMEITIIPGTRPSDRDFEPLKKVEKAAKKVSKNLDSIKKGISRLERDMKKIPIK